MTKIGEAQMEEMLIMLLSEEISCLEGLITKKNLSKTEGTI